jgi:hypothetical protein
LHRLLFFSTTYLGSIARQLAICMGIKMNRKYMKLAKNLEAMIFESTVKIGYCKGQPVGIYYTPELLGHLLSAQDYPHKSMQEFLDEFTNESRETLGEVTWTKVNGRYLITVSGKGIDYIYEKNKENYFLPDLINVLKKSNLTIEMILEVFHQYSDEVLCEKSNDDEFEYSVRFLDKDIDEFIYCFTFDELGQYYHRFTVFDFKNMF